MKMQKIREMTAVELDNMLGDLLKERLNLNIQSRTGQLENTARFGQLRKDIAKIKTEQNGRKVSASVK
ncbi:MAG: 50S ribosomal protein L29 [Lentisphaerae bacterium GWF2_45_14]|nr:MAG: 50S ribosomal protein L29 [Lentisphaerae bacterium GWF2_45_14]